ncbi:MAG: hypothetical protein P4L57_06395 [Rhizomicrobium sp.]|nr:hypothetical protein [Rhizomicrobium sp.]
MAIIKTKRLSNGTFVEVLPDGSTRPSVDKTDWERLKAMTEEEVMAAALSDPDAQPLTEEQLSRMKRTPRAKINADTIEAMTEPRKGGLPRFKSVEALLADLKAED